MATTITRTNDVDDDGSYMIGTVRNNAWKQQIYDQIDALFTGALAVGGTGTFATSITVAAAANPYVRISATGVPYLWDVLVGGGGTISFFGNGASDRLSITSTGVIAFGAYTAATFVAGDKYLVVDAAGVIHRSALGPAS